MKKTIEFKLHKEVELPQDLIDSVPRSGPADQAIEELLQEYNIEVSLEDSIKYLKSIGGWGVDELQDLETNIQRLLWISALDCQEQNTNYWYMGS